MFNNLEKQPPDLELKKKATLSFSQGSISIILGAVSIILPYIMVWLGTGINYGSAKMFLVGMIIALVCAIFGLILGIKGLRMTKKGLAITGIVICTISLFLWIWDILGWLIMGGPIWL